MTRNALIFGFLYSFCFAFAQNTTRKDSLHGGLRMERTCFDVQRYDLDIQVLPRTKKVEGKNDISFKVVAATNKIQLDLFENMQIDSIVWHQQKLSYTREFNAVFVEFPSVLQPASEHKIAFYYQGNPLVAKNAPWDGGFVFSKDGAGKPWIGVAVQGTGASLWYPVKDTQTDEPDKGASVKVAVPNGLMNVSNGRFLGSLDLKNGFTRWDWEVKNPINTYNITLNIGDYVAIKDAYEGLDLEYYVLRENEEKARVHFEADVKPMLACFHSKFGKYPFWEDGYKLVETPYLGMEHQSAVAYGNRYKKGYMGMDLSGTGVGMKFDYITIHETGHEWFGNSITSKDIADMWIHEGFTTYTETVFVECTQGYEAAMTYVNGQARNVRNDKPIIAQFGVNKRGSGDMYYKGSLLLNTLRHIVNDDAKWWAILLNYSETYKKQIIDTPTVVGFFNKETNLNLTPVFDHYLKQKDIPVLEIRKNKKSFEYRWKNQVPDFEMPVDVVIDSKKTRLLATNQWKKATEKVENLEAITVLKKQFFIKVNLL